MNEPLSHDDVAQPARAPALREDAGLTDLASVARDIEIALRRARDYAAELAGALAAIAARASSAERSLRRALVADRARGGRPAAAQDQMTSSG